MAGLKLVTAPSGLAVALADVKSYLRITGTADDTMLTNMINAATYYFERTTNRACINQTWDYYLDNFPAAKMNDAMFQGGSYVEGKLSEFLVTSQFITVPIFPLVTVANFNTYADDGVAVAFSSSLFYVDIISEPGRVSLLSAGSWPSTALRPVNGIQIKFNAGYGASSSSVPAGIQQIITNIVGVFYQQRGCDESLIPQSINAQIYPYRVMRL